MDIGVGLAKLMHRTNIYLPYGTPDGELLDCWNGFATVADPKITRLNFWKTSNYQLSSFEIKT